MGALYQDKQGKISAQTKDSKEAGKQEVANPSREDEDIAVMTPIIDAHNLRALMCYCKLQHHPPGKKRGEGEENPVRNAFCINAIASY